jgi:beta-lactamase class A
MLRLLSLLLFGIFDFSGLLTNDANASIEKLCRYNKAELKSLFSERFLNKVPLAAITGPLDEAFKTHGPCQKVTKLDNNNYDMLLKEAILPLRIYYDGNNLIHGFWMGNPKLLSDSFHTIFEELKSLPGKKSVYVKNFTKKFEQGFNETELLPIGSAFKLYVLKALETRIADKKGRWEDLMSLEEKDKSLPSGKLHKWIVGSKLTIDTLSSLMISESDNTATDMLIRFLGKNEIEKIYLHQRPFLNTQEWFALSHRDHQTLLLDYVKMNEKQKRKAIKNLDLRKLENSEDILFSPISLNIAWNSSNKELCELIYGLKNNRHLKINPGLAKPTDWDSVLHKGGSTPISFQLTHLVRQKKSKQWLCISSTIFNDDPNTKELLSEEKFYELNQRILDHLKDN